MRAKGFIRNLFAFGGAAALLAGTAGAQEYLVGQSSAGHQKATPSEYYERVRVPAQTRECTDYHIVEKGESVWRIARSEFNLAPNDISSIDDMKDRIVADNPRACNKKRTAKDCGLLYVGDKLTINRTEVVPAYTKPGKIIPQGKMRRGVTYLQRAGDIYREFTCFDNRSTSEQTPVPEGKGFGWAYLGLAALAAAGAAAYAVRHFGRPRRDVSSIKPAEAATREGVFGSDYFLRPGALHDATLIKSTSVESKPILPVSVKPSATPVIVGGQTIGELTIHGGFHSVGDSSSAARRDDLGPEHGSATEALSRDDSDKHRRAAGITTGDDPDDTPPAGGGKPCRKSSINAGGSENIGGSSGSSEKAYFSEGIADDIDSSYLQDLMDVESNNSFDELGGDTRLLEYIGRNKAKIRGREVFNKKLAKELGVYDQMSADIAHKYKNGMSTEEISKEYKSIGVEISARTVGRLAKEALNEEFNEIARGNKQTYFMRPAKISYHLAA